MVANSGVGVDIGSRTITVVEVRQGRGGVSITNFGGVELPPDVAREGEIIDVGAVSEALRELLRTAKVRSKKVWLGVANQRVVVRQITLPWVDPNELQASLRFQVQEHIPIPVEEAELDAYVVSDFHTEEGEHMQQLLLVAAHRDMVQAHADAATGSGLKPIGIDLNPFAVLRAAGNQSSMGQGNQVLVDIGGGVTNIVVHDAGTPTFVRILVMGGEAVTAALASGLGISRDEAEERKRGVSDASGEDDAARRIVDDHVGQLVEEIRNSLDYYRAQTGAAQLSDVVLVGGGAALPGLPERLASSVGLPVDIDNPFDRWQAKDTVYGPEELAQVGPSLSTAVGLALGGLE